MAHRGPRRVSLSFTLTAGLAALVLLSVLAVLAIGLWSARTNTMTLLSEQARLSISSALAQIDQHLKPAEAQASFIARLIAEGKVDPTDETRFGSVLLGALSAAPQIKGLVFIDRRNQLFGAARTDVSAELYTADYARDATIAAAVEGGAATDGPTWGDPVWRSRYQRTLLNLRHPVRRNGEYLGILAAIVSINELSGFLKGLTTTIGKNAFILYGRENVLAHSDLIEAYPGLSERQPLPSLAQFGDATLATIWREEGRAPVGLPLPEELSGVRLEVAGTSYLYFFREIRTYGAIPWYVGSYFRVSEVNAPLRRLVTAAAAGVAAVVLALVASVWFARTIARPVHRLAAAARAVGELEAANVPALPGSLFREIDDQANAFNAMLRGLKWFEIYVPKTLVRRLIRQGDPERVAFDAREVTIMFTDIAGFTTLAEGRSAADVAGLLNEHFSALAEAVEREGGTVDKFIGDGMMAFWGAPEPQTDHASRAVRAALAIRRAVDAQNAAGRRLRIRIGLHTGTVTVGNIGAPGRMNYTIVGDAVNVAQRLEQLCKEVGPDDGVTILASATTVAAAQGLEGFVSAGRHAVKGRLEPVDTYRLSRR